MGRYGFSLLRVGDTSVARTVFLQIRLTEDEKRRVESAARATYLDMSTWARMIILRAVEHSKEEPSKDRNGGS